MSGAERGGAETYFVNLVLALHRAGVSQQVAIRRNAERAAILRAGGVDPAELRFGRRFDFFTTPRLRRLAAEFRPEVVVSWMSRAAAMLPRGDYVHIGRLGGYYDLKSFRGCDHLVCNTQDLVRHCIDGGFAADRVHYLPNFVSFTPRPAQSRADLDTPADVPLLLAMGRLHPVKAFDILIRALAAVPGAYLWLAGEGAEGGSLQALAAQLGVADRVRFLGWRNDREALYAAADLCIVPSRSEPFGNVILDAWTAGIPLVAAAALGPAAYVINEENGLLVPIDDADALALAVNRLIGDPALRQRLVDGGRATWSAEFTETKVVGRWRDLFTTVTA